jgi:positive regulator of sigma E activity
MKDKGIVLSTRDELAEVEVSCLDGCQDCSARSLCGSDKDKKGSLKALNPVGAHSGDIVSLDIPDSVYSRQLIRLFGGLLAGAVSGAFLGYILSPYIPISSDIAALFGLFSGGAAAGWMLFHHLRRDSRYIYPVITGIIPQKGDSNG